MKPFQEFQNATSSSQGETFNTLTYRERPFPQWVTKHINPEESTYLELTNDENLYYHAIKFVLKHTQQSFRGEVVRLAKSAETKLMEQLARERMAKKKMEAGETKTEDECEQQEEKRCRLSLGLGMFQFSFMDQQLWALHQTIGDPVATQRGTTLFTSLIILVEGVGRRDVLEAFCEAAAAPKSGPKQSPLFFQIYRDMERFLSEDSLRWYFEHGIPYRRSYLFYGVPGSGKSSLIQALAGKFSRNLCFLQPMHPKMTDEVFKSCIESAPAPSMIVLEDIDALFGKDRSKKHVDCPLTFSGLLNGLDGVGGLDGQIFIMTTNFVSQLDDALIRSGRVDLYLEFSLAVDEQILKMFEMFCPEDSGLCDEFLAQCREVFPEGVSMAALQQHFIQQIFQPARAVIDSLPQLGERLDVVTRFDERIKKSGDVGEVATESA